jgi:hypothetical protein
MRLLNYYSVTIMYKLKITTTSNNIVTIYFNTNITVSEYKNRNTGLTETSVSDGRHNNGGWPTLESAESVEARIDALIAEARENKMLAMF